MDDDFWRSRGSLRRRFATINGFHIDIVHENFAVAASIILCFLFTEAGKQEIDPESGV